jgi:hypothetical protein
MLAKQNTGGNAAKFFQRANGIFRHPQDFPGPADKADKQACLRAVAPPGALLGPLNYLHLPNSVLR